MKHFSGGGDGIGRAVAQLFSKEGASIVVADINEAGADETVKSLPQSELQNKRYGKVTNLY